MKPLATYIFSYHARGNGNIVQQSTIKASSKQDAERRLATDPRLRGMTLVSLSKKGGR